MAWTLLVLLQVVKTIIFCESWCFMRIRDLLVITLVFTLSTGNLLAETFAMSVSEREEAYRWLLRLRKDVGLVMFAAQRGMNSEGPHLENELLYHDKWMANEWCLKPAMQDLFEGDKEALEPLLERLDETTDGFTCKGKKLRFVDILSYLDKLRKAQKTDFGKPDQSGLKKAYKQLFEKEAGSLVDVLGSAFSALNDFVENPREIEQEEGGLTGKVAKTKNAKFTVTFTALYRLHLDLERIKSNVAKDGMGKGISLGSAVLEHRHFGRNSWYLQKQHIAGFKGLRLVLKKRLGELDSQSTGVSIDGKTQRYSDLLKKIDKLDDLLEIDMGKPDRSEMKKAAVELTERIDDTLKLTKALIDGLAPLTDDSEQIQRAEGGNDETAGLDEGFGGLNVVGND